MNRLEAISKMFPGRSFSCKGGDFDSLESISDHAGNALPSEAEVDAFIASYVPPVVVLPVPESVLSHQLFTALSRRGITEAMIEAIIKGMPEGQAKVESGIAFRRAPQIRRDHSILLGIAMALSLSSETVDNIFRESPEI